MCNLAEYIVVRRAMHIILALTRPNSDGPLIEGNYKSYFSSMSETISGCKSLLETVDARTAVAIQSRLKDIFTLVIEGCTLKRFVGFDAYTPEGEALPIFLLEVFQPSHAWIPIFVTNKSVLMVSPFKNPIMEKYTESPYIGEIFPSDYLLEDRTFQELTTMLYEPITSDPEESIDYSDDEVGAEANMYDRARKDPATAIDVMRAGMSQNDRNNMMIMWGGMSWFVFLRNVKKLCKETKKVSQEVFEEMGHRYPQVFSKYGAFIKLENNLVDFKDDENRFLQLRIASFDCKGADKMYASDKPRPSQMLNQVYDEMETKIAAKIEPKILKYEESYITNYGSDDNIQLVLQFKIPRNWWRFLKKQVAWESEDIIDVEEAQKEVCCLANCITEAINVFTCGIQNSDKALSSSFAYIPADKACPTEVGAESVIMRKIRSVYGTESLAAFESALEDMDEVIGKTDFMPIFISSKTNVGPAAYIQDEGITKISSINTYASDSTDSDRTVTGILTKENLSYGQIYVIELDDPYFYIGNCKVGEKSMDGSVTTQEPLLNYVVVEGDELTEEEALHGIGTESVVSSVKQKASALATIAQKFGVKSGSLMYEGLRAFLKLPTDAAKWIFNTMMGTFKRGIDLEKAETLEMQEKLLNDEIDVTMERFRYLSQIHLRAIALSIILNSFALFPVAWLLMRSRTKKSKLKALDRLELKINGGIERLQKKINHAEERSDNESEDSLMKELQMYKLAQIKLIELKRDAYKENKITYVTFDKELTMRSNERIANILRSSGNPDY